MAQIPGLRFDVTGASGSQGLLAPKSNWRAYVFPRGGYAAQDSAGTKITFDSTAIAGRFAVGNWIQVGEAATIRQVAAVGGTSLTVSGSAVTVTKGNRIYIIGNTEPTISGGSVTYSTPATTIRQRDDDAADLYTNSMVTTNTNGLVQFFTAAGIYDVLVQDGNQAIQGSLIDVPIGLAEGVSTTNTSVFGATVTVNANMGVTGTFTVNGQIVISGSPGNMSLVGSLSVTTNATITGLLSSNGRAKFGSTATFDANAGITGTFTFGSTATFSAGIVGTTATFSQTIGTSGNVVFNRIAATQGTALTAAGVTISGWGTGATWSVQAGSNDARGAVTVVSGSSPTTSPNVTVTFSDGNYSGQVFYVVSRADQHDYAWKVSVGGVGSMSLNYGSSTNVPSGTTTSYTFVYMAMG